MKDKEKKMQLVQQGLGQEKNAHLEKLSSQNNEIIQLKSQLEDQLEQIEYKTSIIKTQLVESDMQKEKSKLDYQNKEKELNHLKCK